MSTLRNEIRETVTPWKFGGDRYATMLWLLSMDGGEDEQTGSTEWNVWCARFGRHLLFTDDQGFVWANRYATETEAAETFNLIDREYCDWRDED